MRNSVKAIAVIAVLVAGIVAAPVLNAHDSGSSDEHNGSMIGPGMMGQDGMMNMMEQVSQMMEDCNEMMQGAMDDGSGRPNEQWREDAPAAPEPNG
jgi:hypothetical protein